MSGNSFGLCVLPHLYLVRVFVASCALSLYELQQTKFWDTNFSITNLSRYESYTIRTLSCTNICIRTLAYEPFTIRTFSLKNSSIRTVYIRTLSVTNFLNANLILYELVTLRTSAMTNFLPYELYPIRRSAYEHLLTDLFLYEPYAYEPRSWKHVHHSPRYVEATQFDDHEVSDAFAFAFE